MFTSLIQWHSVLVEGAQPYPTGTGDLLGLQGCLEGWSPRKRKWKGREIGSGWEVKSFGQVCLKDMEAIF